LGTLRARGTPKEKPRSQLQGPGAPALVRNSDLGHPPCTSGCCGTQSFVAALHCGSFRLPYKWIEVVPIVQAIPRKAIVVQHAIGVMSIYRNSHATIPTPVSVVPGTAYRFLLSLPPIQKVDLWQNDLRIEWVMRQHSAARPHYAQPATAGAELTCQGMLPKRGSSALVGSPT
jgi:hypothetical protein